MSEFKFACPVCGQHITADSANTGARIECPTCFQKIIVPQAPAAADPKFILSASQEHQRPIPTVSAPSLSQSVRPVATSTPILVIAAIVVCAAGGAVFAFREKISRKVWQPAAITNSDSGATKGGSSNLARVNPAPLVVDTNWTLNLSNAVVADKPVAGRIHGKPIVCHRATLQGGRLDLRQGGGGADPGVTIQFFSRPGEDLSRTLAEKSFSITTEMSPPVPRVVLRWKDDPQPPMSLTLREGYALQLDFGALTNNRISGRIYLAMPDEAKSYLSGNFDAEIRRPPPARPRPKRPDQP